MVVKMLLFCMIVPHIYDGFESSFGVMTENNETMDELYEDDDYYYYHQGYDEDYSGNYSTTVSLNMPSPKHPETDSSEGSFECTEQPDEQPDPIVYPVPTQNFDPVIKESSGSSPEWLDEQESSGSTIKVKTSSHKISPISGVLMYFPPPQPKRSLCTRKIRIKTTLILEPTHTSVDAVEFLKGTLVTRFMPSFYIIIILLSLPLNALALVTFTCRIREKKPAVIYMSHLACVDLLFALLLPLKIHYQLNASDWLFGEAACRVLTAAYYCYMYCSILLMMCMSVDRLLGVALPIASLTWRNARKASFICALVWLLALAGTVPILLMRQTVKIEDVGITCHDMMKANDKASSYYAYLFSILSCLYFFLPLVITLVSYSTIIYVLSVKSDRISSSFSNKRRAVIMTISVLTEFVVCFAPTHGILLYHCIRLARRGETGEGNSSYAAYMLAVCLGSASVFLDPLLYYYGSSHYRQLIKSVFWCKKAKKRSHRLP
ncbi:proteinase-activated receptor 1-like isoform X1 [Danio rerio]|uniref:Proteinase-activated receptor 1 n=1 Tax=Danio rerio TaxID=7955 RepID=A0A8M6YX59_DANRE